MARYDAVVIGAGPNGLAAAVELARNQRSVIVLEAAPEIGGGCVSGPIDGNGCVHDHCSAVHPLAELSPLFRELPLADHGLEWLHPPLSVAHPLDDRPAVVLARSFDETGERLGGDGEAWRALIEPFVADSESLLADLPVHELLIGPISDTANHWRSGPTVE